MNKSYKELDTCYRKMSIIVSKELYHEYLNRLDQMKSYQVFLKTIKKKDNLTNLKLFFNKYIFISIYDFHHENYHQLFFTKKDLKHYLNKNPEKRSHKKLVKQEKVYKILLRDFRMRNYK